MLVNINKYIHNKEKNTWPKEVVEYIAKSSFPRKQENIFEILLTSKFNKIQILQTDIQDEMIKTRFR